MRVLITGASGFVGGSLAQALASRFEILTPTSRELDLLDPERVSLFLEEHRVDTVIHCAVRTSRGAFGEVMQMQANLIRAMGAYRRLVYFGSGAEFGKHRDMRRVSEESIGEHVPQDDYGMAKLFCNAAARALPNIVNLRLFGAYGPRESYLRKFISNAVAKHIAGMDLVIRQDVVFHYLWIDDLVPVVEWALNASPIEADYNVVPTESVALTEIAAVVNEVGGRKANLAVEAPGLHFEYTASNARLLRDAGNLTFTPIATGVELLFRHYRANRHLIDEAALRQDDYARNVRVRGTATP